MNRSDGGLEIASLAHQEIAPLANKNMQEYAAGHLPSPAGGFFVQIGARVDSGQMMSEYMVDGPVLKVEEVLRTLGYQIGSKLIENGSNVIPLGYHLGVSNWIYCKWIRAKKDQR